MSKELLARSGLSIRALHALVQLSQSASLTEAAGGGENQPTYSKYLRELSSFFGVSLTTRVGRVSRLSPAGIELAKLAREHLAALSDFKRRATDKSPIYAVGAGDSLINGLLIPALAQMPRGKNRCRFAVHNRTTAQLVSEVANDRLDFALLRSNAVESWMGSQDVCLVRHVIVVPRRLVSQRGILRLKEALLEVPHACVAGDGELVRKIRELAQRVGGHFRPELECESHGQCLAAVRCGTFAAVVPTQIWEPSAAADCVVIEEPELDALNRTIALAWLPRKIDVLGPKCEQTRDELVAALLNASEQRGMVLESGERASG